MSSDQDVVICKCGRSLKTPHCFNCGQGKIYRFAKKKVTKIVDRKTGMTKDFAVFRCDKCGVFDEYQLLYECNAPELKSIEQKHKEELDKLITQILDPIQYGPLSKHECYRFKKLFGMEAFEYRRLVFTARQENKSFEAVQAEDIKKKLDIKEAPKQNGIRRFGRKWSIYSNTPPPANWGKNINLTPNNPANTANPDTKETNNGDKNTTKPDVVGDGSSGNSSSGFDNIPESEDVILKQVTEDRKRNKEIKAFEGGLSDEDLRNLPGVMEVSE